MFAGIWVALVSEPLPVILTMFWLPVFPACNRNSASSISQWSGASVVDPQAGTMLVELPPPTGAQKRRAAQFTPVHSPVHIFATSLNCEVLTTVPLAKVNEPVGTLAMLPCEAAPKAVPVPNPLAAVY